MSNDLKADPKIGAAGAGPAPVRAEVDIIGVWGAPGGDKDHACAPAGPDKVAAQAR